MQDLKNQQMYTKFRDFTPFDIIDLKHTKLSSLKEFQITLPRKQAHRKLSIKSDTKMNKSNLASITYFIELAGEINDLTNNRITYSCILKIIINPFENKKVLLNLYFDGKVEMFNYNNSKPENWLHLTKDSRIKVNETDNFYKELSKLQQTEKTYLKLRRKYCFNFLLENTAFQRGSIEFSLCDYDDYLDIMQSMNKVISYFIQIDKIKKSSQLELQQLYNL